jgi:hypothetical protein
VNRLPLFILPGLVGLALVGTALTALAAQVNFGATLSGAEEVPPNDSPGTGTLEVDYDSETNLFNYTVTYSGLTGDPTAAHFHGPAAPGENAPPVIPVEGPLASPISGTATLTDAQEAELLGGMWYFNLHTAQYPDGELRGQVLQVGGSGEVSTLPADSSMTSSDSSLSSSLSSMSSSSSELCDVSSSSLSCEVSVSVSVDPSSMLSSASSESSSAVSSVSSEVSSALSSASSELDPSASVSVSASASGEVSVAP